MNWYVELDDAKKPRPVYFGPMTKRRARVVADAVARAFARSGDCTWPIIAREITEAEFDEIIRRMDALANQRGRA